MLPRAAIVSAVCLAWSAGVSPQQSLPRYYAFEAVEDRHGVIAPWYGGQNGQLDFRVRVAAETLKRYPWATDAPSPAPHYVYNGSWRIAPDGTITIPEIGTVKAKRRPYVMITSNQTRELHDALKRRCLYHWIDYPSVEKELPLVMYDDPYNRRVFAVEIPELTLLPNGDYQMARLPVPQDWVLVMEKVNSKDLNR